MRARRQSKAVTSWGSFKQTGCNRGRNGEHKCGTSTSCTKDEVRYAGDCPPVASRRSTLPANAGLDCIRPKKSATTRRFLPEWPDSRTIYSPKELQGPKSSSTGVHRGLCGKRTSAQPVCQDGLDKVTASRRQASFHVHLQHARPGPWWALSSIAWIERRNRLRDKTRRPKLRLPQS